MVKLSIRDLGKQFGGTAGSFQALQGISFDVHEGEFLTIIGPSGSGKSTLLRCLAGFEEPTQGSITLDGRPIQGPGIDRMMVFQGFEQLFPWLSVRDNITFSLKQARIGHTKSERNAIAQRYLQLVGLSGFEKFHPHELSGGMKQRVAIARALSVQPKVLLMDEPFGSLDALTRSTLETELARIWLETRVTVVFVTHNIEEAIVQADRILVLASSPGRIKEMVVNPLPRPRCPEMEGYARLWEELRYLLGFSQTRESEPDASDRPALVQKAASVSKA
ncbi:MAG: ABC transporter ATP-binding protein [Bacillota bacterium]